MLAYPVMWKLDSSDGWRGTFMGTDLDATTAGVDILHVGVGVARLQRKAEGALPTHDIFGDVQSIRVLQAEEKGARRLAEQEISLEFTTISTQVGIFRSRKWKKASQKKSHTRGICAHALRQ